MNDVEQYRLLSADLVSTKEQVQRLQGKVAVLQWEKDECYEKLSPEDKLLVDGSN